MMVRLTSVFLLVVATAWHVQAANTAVESIAIRDGINYVRIRDLDADLGPVAAAFDTNAAILDLRYVVSSASGARAISELMRGKADRDAKAPLVLALVNHATTGPLEDVLAGLQSEGRVLLVGTPTAGAIKDKAGEANGGAIPLLRVETTPDDDQAAYAALKDAASLAGLLDTTIDKPRFDEARLMREHSGQGIRDPHRGAVSPSATPPAGERPPQTTPVLDRTLHRAVNTILAAEALGC